jgi:hypothetical protein
MDCEARNSQFSNANEECEKNPAVVLHAITPPVEHGPWELYAAQPKPKPPPAPHLLVLSDAELNTQEYGSLVCGHVRKGDVVVLLQDGGLFVKVKTKNGQVGWSMASDFQTLTATQN